MKNKIIHRIIRTFLFVSLIVTPAAVFAWGEFNLGGEYNPINVQIVQDPTEQLRLELNALESRLKMQYGYSLYTSCMPSSCLTADSIRDVTTRSACLRSLEYKLGSGSCEAQKPTCPVGTTLWNGSCYTPDQGCRAHYGEYSYSKSVTTSGKFNCDCMSGYQWDPTGADRCMAIPIQKTQDQLCAEKYLNSRSIGGYCDCPSGYQFNSARTQCDVIPTKTNDQACKNDYANSYWTGELNAQGGATCDCVSGYQWNQGQTRCEMVPTHSSGGGGGYKPSALSVVSTFTYDKNLSKVAKEREMLTNESAKLRSCPARTCEQKGVYPSGTIFTVRQQYGESDLWYRGTMPDGNEGWIYFELLTEHNVITGDEAINGPATSTAPLLQEMVETPAGNHEPAVTKKSIWKKIISWFSFWK